MMGCARTRAPLMPDVGPAEHVEPDPLPPLPPVTVAPPAEAIYDIPDLSELSLREKAGQLVIPWISGEYWAADHEAMATALRLAREERVGGFVVGLGGSAYDLAAKFNALQRASRLPLLIAADLESGPAMRVRGSTAFSGNMAIGASGREDDAWEVGRVVALEGRAIGIHITFAPVVDVNNNPANPIINTRSYGEDPRRVGLLGSAFVRGLRQHGMMATAKHFPGHGDTDTDTHLSLPLINLPRARLDSVELVPFRLALDAGVDAVMTAHIALPAIIGNQDPATMSALMLDTLLRHQLGFRGLVVTDALDMGAIVNRYGAANAAVRAFQAGSDVLLMPTDAGAAIDGIVAAVQRGEISEARLDSSVTRILFAKARAGLFRRRIVDLESIARVVGIRASAESAARIAERSIVLVKDSLSLLPLTGARRSGVAVITYSNEGGTGVGGPFVQPLRAGGLTGIRQHRLWPASGPASFDSVRAITRGAGAIIVLVSARPVAWRPDAVAMPDSLAALVQALSLQGAPVITVALGSPYLFGQVPGTSAYLAAWSDIDVAQISAARAILGLAPITGRLPVALPPYPVGAGLQRNDERR